MSDRSQTSRPTSKPIKRRSSRAEAGVAPVSAGTWTQAGLTELILSQWRAEKPEIEGRAFEIGTLLTRLNILLGQLEVRSARALGLRPGEIRLLYALRRIGPPFAQRPTDLFRLLGVTSGGVTYTVNRLKAHDLVEGVDDPRDGRSQMVRLTPSGLALIDALVQETAGLLDLALRPLPDDEQAAIQHGLSRLAACLETFTDHGVSPSPSEVEDRSV